MEVKNLSNRQTVFFLPVDPMDKNHKDPDTIDLTAPRHAQYMHKAWNRHQNAVYWVDINLALKKGLKFYQTRSNAIILHETLQLIVFRKLFRWKLEKSYTRKYIRHLGLLQRSPCNMNGKENWVQKMFNDQKDKLCNKSKISNRTKQFQTQIMMERSNPLLEPIEWGNQLLKLTREPRKMEEKRPVPRRSIHVLVTKKLSKPIERGNPLFKRVEPTHVHLMTARVSTLNWHMTDRGNPLSKQTQKMCQMVAKHVLVMKA